MILESFKSKADKIVYTINMQRYQKLHILFFLYPVGDSEAVSTYFGTMCPLSMFSTIHPLFLQKTKPLYPHPNSQIYIGLFKYIYSHR